MTMVNLDDLIGSRYKTIHQVMYKTKDKERKERTRARLLLYIQVHEPGRAKARQ